MIIGVNNDANPENISSYGQRCCIDYPFRLERFGVRKITKDGSDEKYHDHVGHDRSKLFRK